MSKDGTQTITTLCLVRHGESTWNAEGRIQGQLNPPLSELGLEQADLVAKRLADETWSAIYSSDLSRARQTAEAIAKLTGHELRIETQLRERTQGKREGYLLEEARELYPDIHAPEVEREDDEALTKRAVDIYQQIRDRHLGERILIVAHGALMGVFLQNIIGPLDDLKIENTSCTLLRWDGSSWDYEYVADATHLVD